MTELASRTTAIGAVRLLESLERLGVELVFGLPGVHNPPIWKALSESHVRLVGVRHEQVAVVDAAGRVGVHTGPKCIACAGHITGDGVSCQANIMAPSVCGRPCSRRAWPRCAGRRSGTRTPDEPIPP